MQIDPNPVSERRLLPPLDLSADEVADLLSRGRRPPEGWTVLEPESRLAGFPVGGVDLCVLHDALHDPRTGLILTRDGRVPASVAEVLRGGTNAALKRIGARPSGQTWDIATPPADSHDTAALWLGGGSMRNYGHFLFDSLTAVAALEDRGLLRKVPAFAPLLSTWQSDLLDRAGLLDRLTLSNRPAIIGTAIFTTAFGHYLHRSHGMLARLAERLGRPGRAPKDGATLYLSRRGYAGRIMLGERDLERRLIARGVEVLRPERMQVREQAACMARASTVIGCSGAAMANMVFLGRGARVIEIRPGRLSEPWIDLGCANLGLEHHVVPASDDLPARSVPALAHMRQIPRKITGRYNYVYDVDPTAVLRALER